MPLTPLDHIAEHRVSHLIIGFPKCGTTSLAEWLASVDGVSVSSPKETFRLCPEFSRGDSPLGAAWFPSDESRVRIEATTLNVYSDELLSALVSHGIKVVAVYRRPWEAAASWKNQVALADPDLPGLHLLNDPSFMLSYGTHLKRWRDALGDERLLIIELSELEENPSDLSACLSRFLGVRVTGEPPKLNRFYAIRFPLVYSVIRGPRVKRALNAAVTRSDSARRMKQLVREKVFMRTVKKPEASAADRDGFESEYALAQSLRSLNRRYWSEVA